MGHFAKRGVFFVPNGDLESWAPDIEDKVRFSESAPDLIKGDEGLRSPLAKFLGDCLDRIGGR